MRVEDHSRSEYMIKYVYKQLSEFIMPFWGTDAVDHRQGGFYAHINHDMTIDQNAVKKLVLNSRILWTFSAMDKTFKSKQDEELSERAYHSISTHFFDRQNGEWFFRIDLQGNPITSHEKAGFWKCSCHNARACLEIVHRVNVLNHKPYI